MAEPFAIREHWRDVSSVEFEAFLRDYTRPLEAHPPLSHKGARFRQWLDASLGTCPDNAIAKTWNRGRCRGYQIRCGVRAGIRLSEVVTDKMGHG